MIGTKLNLCGLNCTDVRMEEFLYEKLERKIPTRANNHELLGECMIDAGHEFGPGTAYGEKHLQQLR